MMFFQSGGCCDGSLPMCFDDGEFIIGDHDVLLGHVGGCPFYIDHRQFEAWKHTQLILDVGEGDRRASHSLPGRTSTSSSDHGCSAPMNLLVVEPEPIDRHRFRKTSMPPSSKSRAR